MNHQSICDHLSGCGYSVSLDDKSSFLTVSVDVAGRSITLIHYFPERIRKLPQFALKAVSDYEMLAHVLPVNGTDLGQVCVNAPDSVSINFEVPELAYEASLERHISLLTKAITDPEWNRAELIREFRTNWDLLCSRAGTAKELLYIAYDPDSEDECLIKSPVPESSYGISSHFLGLGSEQAAIKAYGGFRDVLRWGKRAASGKTVVLELEDLSPAPVDPATLKDWYLAAFDHLSPKSRALLDRIKGHKSKTHWLVFTSQTPAGRMWCALRLSSKIKSKLPILIDDCESWKIHAIPVRSMDKGSIVPRGGGHMDLTEKSVLLVGCGSVGSELSHRLASTGIGSITLSDPDKFSQDNLYRHTLSIIDIELDKTFSLAFDLRRKYPWIRVEHNNKRLEELTDIEQLNQYDLIIVAIGSPTIERQFSQITADKGVTTPILNVWLEAYGIGGHATLDLPKSRGCLMCAYVDPDDFSRGLVSNLNFLAPNQDVTVSHGGCGNLFMPYSAIASNYTATMAADLAVRYMSGNIRYSSKVSWKGDSQEAERQGLAVTPRYHQFDDSFNVLPLKHPECDICGN